jgi:hypothetical protein
VLFLQGKPAAAQVHYRQALKLYTTQAGREARGLRSIVDCGASVHSWSSWECFPQTPWPLASGHAEHLLSIC